MDWKKVKAVAAKQERRCNRRTQNGQRQRATDKLRRSEFALNDGQDKDNDVIDALATAPRGRADGPDQDSDAHHQRPEKQEHCRPTRGADPLACVVATSIRTT